MSRPATLVTGANGEIGRSLLSALAGDDTREIVTLDLTSLSEAARPVVTAGYTGSVQDRHLLDQVVAHHDIDTIFHLAALLSARGEHDPELAHAVNVEGTLNVLRAAHLQSSRLRRRVRVLFPSSIAVYGMGSAADKRASGRVREEDHNAPITIYGCNKLYGEHLGRYFARHVRPAGGGDGYRLDFRALRFPGLVSAETLPAGGSSDYGPAMVHAAAAGRPYRSFVGPEARVPFMAMPDAVRALLELAGADAARLTTCVYNVGAFSPTAADFAARTVRAFPGAKIEYDPDPMRAAIVDSWPEDVDDARARADWGWQPAYGWDRMFDEYLVPTLRARRA
jgi:nucleoside-diphosphate-sugar epimerase